MVDYQMLFDGRCKRIADHYHHYVNWSSSSRTQKLVLVLSPLLSQMLHVWYIIYLQNWAVYGVNVGQYSIHGAYGFDVFFQADLLAEKPTLQRFTEIFGVTFPKQMSRHVFVVQHQPADCWAVNPLFLSSVPRLVKWGQENPVQPRCFRKIMVGNGETLLPDRQTICNSYYLSSVLCFN